MEEYKGKAVIQDLPPELLTVILKNLNNCDERNVARKVSRLWNEILNQDSRTERFNVLKHFKYPTPVPVVDMIGELNGLLGCTRRNICYDFRVDRLLMTKVLYNFNQFFLQRGSDIRSIAISLHLFHADYSEFQVIGNHCPNLQTITLQLLPVIKRRGCAKLWLSDYNGTFPSVEKVVAEKIILQDERPYAFSLIPLNDPYLQISETVTLLKDLKRIFPNSKCIEIFHLPELGMLHQSFKTGQLNENVRIIVHDRDATRNPSYRNNCISYGNITLGEPTIYRIRQLRVNLSKPDILLPGLFMEGWHLATSEQELIEFSEHASYIRLNVYLLDAVVNFPFRENSQQAQLSKLTILMVQGGTILFDELSNVYTQLDVINLHCYVINFGSIIHKLSNVTQLGLLSISYEDYVTICDKMFNLQILDIDMITGFDPNIVGTNQNNLSKLKKLIHIHLPKDVIDTEDFP